MNAKFIRMIARNVLKRFTGAGTAATDTTHARRPVYWMCHPLAGNVQDNLHRAKMWYCYLLHERHKLGFDVAADWILWCEVLDDTNPECRADGLRFDCAMVQKLDGVVLVGGRISGGMQQEAEAARNCGKPVKDLTHLGVVPPPVPL